MKKWLVALALLQSVAFAKDVTEIVINAGPGGGLDMSARHIQKFLKDEYDMDTVVTYKPGADGSIGLGELNRTGKGIMYATISSVANYMKTDGDVRLVVATHKHAAMLMTNPKSGVNTFQDFLNSKGKTVSYNSLGQLANIEQLERTGVTLLKIPYKGAGENIMSVLNGTTDFAIVPYSLVKQQISLGKLVPLATTSYNRDYPNLPILEKRHKGWIDITGYCFVLPKSASSDAVDKWRAILTSYKDSQYAKEYYSEEYATPYPSDERALLNIIKLSTK